jgi:hypothetical protein
LDVCGATRSRAGRAIVLALEGDAIAFFLRIVGGRRDGARERQRRGNGRREGECGGLEHGGLDRWGHLAAIAGCELGRRQRAPTLRGLDGGAGAGRDELEGGLVVADLRHVGAVVLAGGAVILAL